MISDNVLTAFIVGLPPTIAAIGALIVSIRNGQKSTEIHTLVDGQLTEIKRKLVLSAQSVDGLKLQLADSVALASNLKKDLSISKAHGVTLEHALPAVVEKAVKDPDVKVTIVKPKSKSVGRR